LGDLLHPNGRRSVNFSDKKTVMPMWLAALCIAMLLLSTTAQAVHFCELSLSGERVFQSSQPASPNSAVCLICVMAHSAAAAVLVIVFSPTFRKRARVSVPQVRPRLFLESFQLYVRPPPAV
jgi:hypothetical protein